MSSPNALSLPNPEQQSERPRIFKAIGGLALKLHGKEKAEKEIAENQLIHDRIIKYLYSDYGNFLNSGNPNLSKYERQEVFNRINSGEIDLDYESESIFESVHAPISDNNSLERLYNSILDSTNMSSILYYAIEPENIEKAQKANEQMSKKFLSRLFPNPQDYEKYSETILGKTQDPVNKNPDEEHSFAKFTRVFPNPRAFEPIGDAFLESIKNSKNPLLRVQYKQYEKDMKKFKNLIYGPQQKYWDQIKAIKKEALDSSKAN